MSLWDEIKEFISYRNGAKRSYIAFECFVKFGDFACMKEIMYASNASLTVATYDNKNWYIKLRSYDKHLSDLKTVLAENV